MNELSWLRKKIQRDKKFNPFSDPFDYNYIIKEIKEKGKKIDEDSLRVALNSPHFKGYFDLCYHFIKSELENLSVTNEKAIKYLIGFANRNAYLINAEIEKFKKGKEQLSLEDLGEFRVDSSNEYYGDINAVAAVELTIDILNVIINYFRYFPDRKVNKNKSVDIIKSLEKIFNIANMYYMVKNAYDEIVWEDGTIDFDENRLFLKFKDEDYLKIKYAGKYRFTNNIFHSSMIANEFAENNNLEKYMDKKVTDFYLDSVKIKSGKFIKTRLLNSNNKNVLYKNYLINNSAIATFYFYLQDVKLKSLDNLTIKDIIFIFSVLQELGNKIYEKQRNPENIKDFIYKIRYNELYKYLYKMTPYSEEKIDLFINLISYEYGIEKRVNMWKDILIKFDTEYHICLTNLVNANILYLIDEWLDLGGFDLDKRGEMLEDYISNILSHYLNEKEYYYDIPEKKEFYISNDKHEEIDLILELKGAIIMAEVKCIKYPMEPRDFHNAYKRLKKGAKQISRKKKFIINNKEKFCDTLKGITKKEIIPIVITNYPFFSGLKINNIDIVDNFLLEAYFSGGEFSKGLVKNKKVITHNKIKYYKNELDMSQNLSSFINDPLPVKDIYNKIEIQLHPIGVSNDSQTPLAEIFMSYPNGNKL